jgi:hypothetical protein
MSAPLAQQARLRNESDAPQTLVVQACCQAELRCSTRCPLWHIAHYVLVGSKVRYLSNFSAAPHFGERPET